MACLGEETTKYSGRMLVVWFLVIYVYTVNAALGPLCYECDHMPHQRDCGKVVRCGSHESCYGMKYVTTDSIVFFRSGCKDTGLCNVGKRDDRTLCSQCCTGDFCNIQTCDQQVTLQHRCFACEFVLNPTDCDLSKQCDVDEICYTEEVYNVNLEKRFRLGCAQISRCRSPPVLAVGKRGEDVSARQTRVSSLPLTTSYCAKCCSGENCNRDLCDGTDSGTDLIVPPALLLCFDYDEDGCRDLIGDDAAPCSDKKIKNMLCPRTCGTCTGGSPNINVGSTVVPTGSGPLLPPGSCYDDGDRCAIDAPTTTLICSVQPQLCKKTCGICNGGSTPQPATTPKPAPVCNDPITTCQCKYLDEQLHICDDRDRDVKMFCCYYCSKKQNMYTCPNSTCDAIEQQEFDRIQKLGISITCHSEIHT